MLGAGIVIGLLIMLINRNGGLTGLTKNATLRLRSKLPEQTVSDEKSIAARNGRDNKLFERAEGGANAAEAEEK